MLFKMFSTSGNLFKIFLINNCMTCVKQINIFCSTISFNLKFFLQELCINAAPSTTRLIKLSFSIEFSRNKMIKTSHIMSELKGLSCNFITIR